MILAGHKLLNYVKNILIKGGHRKSKFVEDILNIGKKLNF